jgi:fibronectin-binding autotransporter adhesin
MFSFRKGNRRSNTSRPIARCRPTSCRRLPLLLEALEARTVLSTVSWINAAGGDWNTAANWSGGVVPGATQDAIINVSVSGPITIDSADVGHSLTDTTASLDITAGSLSLTAASSISQNVSISGDGVLASSGNLTVGGTLSESGGTLTGGGTVTVDGLLTWTGGTMSGSGITSAMGGLSLGASGDTGDSETLAGRTLINAATGVWYDTDTLTQEEDSTFLNDSGATLEIEGAGTWGAGNNPDPSGTFENNGTLDVTNGSATTPVQVQPYFINAGTVDVNSGTLQLVDGGSSTSSSASDKVGFNVASGATLLFGNDYNYAAYAFNSGSFVSGAGSVTFGSGVSANFASGSTYNVSGTTLIDIGGNEDDVVFTAGSDVGPLGDLTINSGVVTFSTGNTVTVASMNLTAGGGVGILNGSDTVDVSGLLTWTDGTMSGPGTTVAEGGLDLGLADGSYHDSALESRTLVNQGTANWVGSGEIDLFSGATLINQLGAKFDEQTNDEIWSDIGVGEYPSGLFDNAGTFVVDGGGTATMETAFDNEGTVEISSGTWELSGDGTSAGNFTMDAGTDLELNIYYGIPYTVDQNGNFVSSPQILGGDASNVTLIDGSNASPEPLGSNAVIPLPTPPYTNFFETGDDTIGSLDMTGGWLTITGTLTVTGPMTWTGGYITGPGTLIVEGGLELGTGTASLSEQLDGVTLINDSTITLTDQDVFAQEYGATVENEILHTIDIQGDATWDGDGTVTIDNQGTIEKMAGSGTTEVNNVALVNDGTVTVSAGTLDLEGGGTATGSFTADAQATLEFGHFSWAFNSTSSVIGAGTVEFDYDYFSSYFNSNSVYDVTGTTVIESQEPVDFLGGHVESMGAVTLEDGSTLDLSSGLAVSATSLTESSGAILTGSDPFSVSGQITWTGGTMSGTGSTVADGTLQLGAPGDTSDVEFLSVRTLEVSGGGTLETQDTLEQSYGSTFVNTATDTLDVLGGASWQSDIDGTATIDNQGALIVGAGTGTATITGGGNFPFLTSPGGIEVLSGTLDLACDGTATGTLPASFTVATGCTLQFNGDFTLGTGAGIGGPGIVEVPSGDLRVTSTADAYGFAGTTIIDGGTIEFDGSASTGTLDESSGDLTGPGTLTVSGLTVWTGGTMDGAGTTIAQGGLQIGQAGDTDDAEDLSGRTLINVGTATWTGGGSISQSYGGTFVNQAGASFAIDDDLTWYSDGTGTFANAGTLLNSADTGITVLGAALDNTGGVQVQSGTLSLQGGGVAGGSYLVQAGATLTFGNDNVTTKSVALPVDFTNSPLNWGGTFTGSAEDDSGSGLASVGVSLFDGTNYYDGTAFESPTAVFKPATLSGNTWTYTMPADNFTSDLAYATGSKATANDGDDESSTITSLLLAPTPATVSAVAPAKGTIAGGETVTITGLGLENATAVDFGQTPATIVSDKNSTIVVTSPPAEAAGSVDVTVTTANGTSATSSADQFTYFVAPTVAMTAPANDAITNNNEPTLSATASEVAAGSGLASVQFEYSSNGGTSWTDAGAAETSGPFSFTFATLLADDIYEARAIATDKAGNSTTSTAVSFTIDTVAPTVAMTAPVNGAFTNKNEPTLSATASDNTGGSGLASVQFEYSSNGGTSWTDAGAAETSGPFSFTFATPLADGTYEARAVATDKAGNSATSSPVSFTINTVAPTPTPTPPSVVNAQVLDVTVITGRGKHQKKTVKFEGFKLTFNEALNSANAQNSSNFQVLQTTKKGRKTDEKPVGFSVSYSAGDDSVSLTLAGNPTFTSGGKLILTAPGITDTSGDTLVGNRVFTILPKAKGISG